MSARIERLDGTEEPERMSGEGIRLPPYTGDTEQPPDAPDVSDNLLRHLRARFPKAAPPEGSGDPAVILGKAWGREEVLSYMEHIHDLQQQEK